MKPRRKVPLRSEQPRTWATRLDGGEDITSPMLDIEPGDLLLSKNYEAKVNGGYERCGNYERFDGRTKPSNAAYWVINFDAGSTEFAEGDVVTGGTSGATGEALVPYKISFDAGSAKFMVGDTVTGGTSGTTAEVVWVDTTSGEWGASNAAGVLYIKAPSGSFSDNETLSSAYGLATANGTESKNALTSGSWGGADAAGTLVLANVTGTFQDNENLEVSATPYAVANGTATEGGANTDADDNRYLMHAISNTRADIGAITGSGIIRGIMGLNGTIYAFRDNAGATAMDLWKATTSGWTQITLPDYLDFDTGTAAFTVGETLTGVTSGATATIDAIVIKSGTTGGGNQAGRLYLSSISGGPYQNNEAITSAGGAALADGANASLTLAAGGKVETIVDNFTGNPTDRKIYGADGVNPAFEFDGTNFYHLVTANTADTPDHVAKHKNYLFLSFGPSVQHSGLGDPRDFTAISGAVEIATGDDVSGFAKAAGDVLTILNRSKTYLLYGTEATSWDLREHASESGAIEWSISQVGKPIYLDDHGLTVLNAVQEYGDFKESSISKKIDSYLLEQKTKVLCCMRVKDKNQYRIFFNDGTGIHARIDRKEPAYTRVEYGKTVYCALSTEDTNGNEQLFFGSDDGYVYQLDKGRSADGSAIEALVRLPFWNMNTPRQIKKFTHAVVFVRGVEDAYLRYTTEFDYASNLLPRGITLEIDAPAAGGFWGSAVWGQFVWGSPLIGETIAPLDGSGSNVGLLIRSVSGHEQNHTLESAIVHYIPRGLKK